MAGQCGEPGASVHKLLEGVCDCAVEPVPILRRPTEAQTALGHVWTERTVTQTRVMVRTFKAYLVVVV